MWIEKLTGDLADKKRYREYKARVKALPDPYREAAGGLERYLRYRGPSGDGNSLMTMLNDLAELCERYGLEMQPDTIPGLVERFGLRAPGDTA